MPLMPAKCPECGGLVEVNSENKAGICQFCGQPFVIEDAINTFNNYFNVTNIYNTTNQTTHNYGDGATVNVYEDKNKDFVIEAGVLKKYHGTEDIIVIPDSVKIIDEKCFENMAIVDVVLHNNIQEIRDLAFSNCNKLKKLIIPKSITQFGRACFYNCENLEEVVFYGNINGLEYLYDGDGYGYTYASSISNFKGAFGNCFNLKKVVFKGNINNIPSYAFCECEKLTDMSIPNSVKSINDHAFYGCKMLSDITIPNGVERIENCAFCGCFQLKEISIPDTVTLIGEQAFRATGLTNITIPKNTTVIGEGVFYDCNLKTLQTPIVNKDSNHYRGVKDYFKITVKKVYNLSEYSGGIPESLEEVKITNGTEIPSECFLGGSNIKRIILHKNIQKIGCMAFSGCSNLQELSLPNALKTLDSSAFENCKSLKSVALPNNLESIGTDIFKGCNYSLKINIPETVAEKIQSDARTQGLLFQGNCFSEYWTQCNKCSHCGAEFNLFNRCKNCGRKRDY